MKPKPLLVFLPFVGTELQEGITSFDGALSFSLPCSISIFTSLYFLHFPLVLLSLFFVFVSLFNGTVLAP